MAMPGPMELALLLLIAVVVFGASRLPKLGEGLGKGIKNFKEALSGKDPKDDDTKKELPKDS